MTSVEQRRRGTSDASHHSAVRVSVVMCTRNRASRLAACLDRIAASGGGSQASWELLVVDNGSTDDSLSVLDRWGGANTCAFRVVAEPRPGLSLARNAGVRAATGELIAFVDDDCLVESDWMERLLAAYLMQPVPDLVGGRVDLHDPADAAISIRPFDDSSDVADLTAVSTRLIGCNFSVRAHALRSIGLFDERLGAGSPSRSGEDLDLFYRLLKAGMRLRYDGSVRVRHAHGRRLESDLADLRLGYLRGRAAVFAKHSLMGDVEMLKHLYWELRRLVSAKQGGDRGALDARARLKAVCALVMGALLMMPRIWRIDRWSAVASLYERNALWRLK